MKKMVLAIALLPTLAFAQTVGHKEDVVLMPKALVQAMAQWIYQPNPLVAVQLYAAAEACLNDNPVDGVVRHSGADQCAIVTQALAAQAAKAPTSSRSANSPLPRSAPH